MTIKRDHFQNDGFKIMNAFSGSNAFVALFLILILVLVGLEVWLTPKSHVIDFEQEVIILWSSHPPVKHERLYR